MAVYMRKATNRGDYNEAYVHSQDEVDELELEGFQYVGGEVDEDEYGTSISKPITKEEIRKKTKELFKGL